MQTIMMFTLYVGVTALTTATALRFGDDGVCSKTETYVASQTARVTTSFVQSYESCFIIFCSTEYRTAYRLQTVTTYTTRSRPYLVCCSGYTESDDECKLKVVSTVAMTSSSPSAKPTQLTTVPSTVPKSLPDATTLPDMSTAAALPAALPLQTMVMISGAVVLLAFVAVLGVLVFVAVARKKRKQRRSSAHSTEGNGAYAQPGGAYYSMIRPTGKETDGANADSTAVELTLPRDWPSTSGPPTPARTKKNTFKNLSLFYAKIIKGKNKAARGIDVQSYDSGSHATDDDDQIVHYYSDMDTIGTKRNQPQGYVDMTSPAGTLAASSTPPTDIPEASNEYSEMDIKEKDQQNNESEPYDKIDFPRKRSIETSSYDHLARQDSLLPSEGVGSVEPNPYDRLDKEDPGEGMNDSEHNVNINKNPYDHLRGSVVVKTKTKEDDKRGKVLREEQSDIPEESLYYNTPEENALKRRESEQDNLYSNVA